MNSQFYKTVFTRFSILLSLLIASCNKNSSELPLVKDEYTETNLKIGLSNIENWLLKFKQQTGSSPRDTLYVQAFDDLGTSTDSLRVAFFFFKTSPHNYDNIQKQKIIDFGKILSNSSSIPRVFSYNEQLSLDPKLLRASVLQSLKSPNRIAGIYSSDLSMLQQKDSLLKYLLVKGDIQEDGKMVMYLKTSTTNAKMYRIEGRWQDSTLVQSTLYEATTQDLVLGEMIQDTLSDGSKMRFNNASRNVTFRLKLNDTSTQIGFQQVYLNLTAF